MGVNTKRMRKSYEKYTSGGDFWQIPEGDTKVYIHPPCLEDDSFPETEGLPYLPYRVHYGLGEGGQMAVCLNTKKNPVLNHSVIKKYLKKRDIKLTGKCPVCDAIENGKMTTAQAQRSGAKMKFLWGLTPLSFRDKPTGKFQKLTPTPSPVTLGRTLYDGIMDIFDQLEDITDFDSTTYVVINRKGTSMTNTKYKITSDGKTTKAPVKLSAAMRKLIAGALKSGGVCDLFNVLAAMVKPEDEVKAIIDGVKLEDEEEEEDFDIEDEEEEEDLEDEELEDEEEEEDLEDEDEDEENEDEELDDDEDDEDLEDEDEEEEEEPESEPKPKKKAKKEARKKSKAVVSMKTKKKKKKAAEDDDEDLDLDELDEELNRLSKKKKKRK